MKLGIAFAAADFTLRPDKMAQAVQERGFESLFFTEHTHIPATSTTRALMERAQGNEIPEHFRRAYDVFVALSFAAAATDTLNLGTGVCLVAERDPIVTAKAVASIDELSGGRFLFGIGAGWIPQETANHGLVPSDRWAVMDEHMRAMCRIWSQDVAEFEGDHVQFGPLFSWPKPRQLPWPPILVGGAGKGAIARVLEYGSEWLPQGGIPAPVLATRIAALRTAAVERGRTGDIPVTVFDAPLQARELEAYREAGVTRALFSAPSAEEETVLRYLDDVRRLADELH